jgi:hypothetical protein
MGSSSTFPADVVELFESGASIVIATRDAELHPEVARACGALVDRSAPRRMTVFLAQTLAKRTLANLADNGRIAVSFTSVFTHRSIQAKGRIVSAEPAAEVHQATVHHYSAAWAETLYHTGIPRAVTRQCTVWPAVALTYDVEDLFIQTPGPKAGVVWNASAER